jgi:hypothetical protein
MFSWFIHNVDYFARPVQITFDGREKYSTFLGKAISFLIYCITISLIVNSWKILFNKVNPKTSMTNTYNADSLLMNLTQLKSIYIASFLTRDFQPFNDPSYLTIETNLFEVKRYDNGTSTFNYYPINQIKCTEYREEFKKKGFEKDFDANHLSHGICLDLKSKEIVMGGNFASNYFSNFNYNLKKCVNTSESNIICKPQDVIDDIIKGGYFEFHYFDSMVDLNNYTKVFNENFLQYFIVLDPKSSKFVDIYFKYVNVSSDIGLIFESSKYDSAVSYDYYKEQIQTSTTDNLVIQFYVNSSKNYVYYTRIYTKFQEFAATVGGLLKIMTFIGSIITSYFTKYEMLEKKFNSFFDFKTNEKQLNLKDESKKLVSIKENLSKNLSSSPIIINPISKKELISQISKKQVVKESEQLTYILKMKFNSIKNDKRDINLNTCHLIKMIMCSCQKKQKLKWELVNIASRKLTKYLDYLKISNILMEFKRVLKILFTKDQRKILKIWTRPNIMIENIKDDYKLIKSDDEKYLSLFYNYCAIRDNKNDKINENLLHFMDEDYKKNFEEVLSN